MALSLQGFPLEISPRVMNTTQELPGQFPFNLDYNSGDTIGFGTFSPRYMMSVMNLLNIRYRLGTERGM